MGTAEILQLCIQGGIGVAALFVLWKVVSLMLCHIRSSTAQIVQMQECFRESLQEVTRSFEAGLDRIESKWDAAIVRLEATREENVEKIRSEIRAANR